MTDRLPDAGTDNEWSFVGGGKVYLWEGGMPAVLGRKPVSQEPSVAVIAKPGGHVIVLTPHQARAAAELLTAAANRADRKGEVAS